MQEAVAAILDMHKSDELMWLELVPPYYPLDKVYTSAARLHILFYFLHGSCGRCEWLFAGKVRSRGDPVYILQEH